MEHTQLQHDSYGLSKPTDAERISELEAALSSALVDFENERNNNACLLQEVSDVRGELAAAMKPAMFPIQRACPVPWDEAERAYRTYGKLFGTSQSLKRLGERGGFGVQEFACLWNGHYPGRCEPKCQFPEFESIKLRAKLATAAALLGAAALGKATAERHVAKVCGERNTLAAQVGKFREALEAEVHCVTCDGTGTMRVECGLCDERGWSDESCGHCHGTRLIEDQCAECHGKKLSARSEKSIAVLSTDAEEWKKRAELDALTLLHANSISAEEMAKREAAEKIAEGRLKLLRVAYEALAPFEETMRVADAVGFGDDTPVYIPATPNGQYLACFVRAFRSANSARLQIRPALGE